MAGTWLGRWVLSASGQSVTTRRRPVRREINVMKLFYLLLTSCFLTHAVRAGEPNAISLLPRMGNLHHPVSTTNEMAQKFFDQGLTFVFGFNHDAAIRSFKRALGYDPNLAMAQW